MAVPTVHRERGYRFAFRAGDRGEPPHIHVVGNGGRAKIWLTPSPRITRVEGYSRSQVGEITDIAQAHRTDWVRAWRAFFG